MPLDPTKNDVDETPDADATATITLAKGGETESATGTGLNLAGLFNVNPTQSTTPDATVPNMADTATSGNVSLQVASRTDDMIFTNCLNDYIDVIYNISLSVVSKQAADAIRADKIDDQNKVTSDDYIVFASTADAATDITSASDNNQVDYYNIQGLTFTTFVGHLPQNPLVAVAVDGTMRLFEPYGFQLREDLDGMAARLGYTSPMTPHEYVYRLEIWFSGYDPRSGAWTPQISIPCPTPKNSANQLKSIVYFVTIMGVEAKVNPSGTYYTMSFSTYTHYATRPENIVLHKDNVGKGGVKIDGGKGQTFRSFLQALAKRLHDQVLIDTQYRIDVTYKFTGFKALLDAQFITDVNMDFTTGVSFKSGDGSHAVSANAMDIYTLIHQVMINLDLVRQLMLREDDPDFIEPSTWWNVRTRITQADSPDNDINSYGKYTFEYVFEPVLSYRSRMSEITDYNRQVYSSSMQQRVQRLLQFGMLVRWYDYYFTNDNSEVIDYQFSFKQFFYQQIPYPGNEISLRGQGHGTGDLNKTDGVSGQQNQNSASSTLNTRDVVGPNISFTPSGGGQTTNELLAISSSPISANTPPSASNYGNIHQHRHRGPTTFIAGDSSADAYSMKALSQRDQYLRFDMLRANMTVRFDPQWLLNPYMAGSDFTPTAPPEQSEDGGTVYVHMDRIIYLNAFAPNQKAFMNPDPSVFNVRTSPILGGFYQVLHVVNEFDGGHFIQKLNLGKYEHLNYYFFGNPDSGVGQGDSSFTATSGFNTNQRDPLATETLG